MKRLHSFLMGLYPKEFREAYRREIEMAFEDRWRDEPGVRVFLEAVWGILMEAPKEHGRLLLQDLKHAWRRAAAQPLISGAMVLTLGLALGMNVTMYALVEGLLVRPGAGIPDAERVVRVYGKDYWRAMTRSYPDYLDLRDGVKAFAAVAAYQRGEALVQNRKQRVHAVTPSFFAVAGVKPVVGRFLEEGDSPNALVVSAGFARRELNGEEQALGHELRIGKEVYRVVGVSGGGFRGFDSMPVELWTLLPQLPRDRGNYGAVNVVARLQKGVSLLAADREANAANLAGWKADGIRQDKEVMQLGPYSILKGPQAPKEVTLTVWLGALSLIVLLLGCGNVALILLARTVRGRRERIVQLALGASLARILRQSAMEGLVVAVLGGFFALGLAHLVTPLVAKWLLPFAAAIDFELGWSALLVAVGGVALAALLTGVVPAIEAARTGNDWGLRVGSAGNGRGWGRGILAGTQVMFTILLLVGAGLFARSLYEVYRLEPGLALEQIVVVRVNSPQQLDRVAARSKELPGVSFAGAVHCVPFESSWRTRVFVPGRDPERRGREGGGRFNYLSQFMSAEGFASLGLHVIDGRPLLATDGPKSPLIAVVNEQFAREVWPEQRAVGKCLQVLVPTSPCTLVVGVVSDSRVEDWFEAPPAQYYLPLSQPRREETASAVLVRGEGDAKLLAKTLDQELRRLGATEARALSAPLDEVRRPWELGALSFGWIGLLALLVSGTGLFGVLSHDLAMRRHEYGLRMALGANRWRLTRLVSKQLLWSVGPGLMLGLLLGYGGAHALQSLLYGIEISDWLAYAGAAGLVVLVALLAALVPWRQTLRIDPAALLRSE